MSNRMEFRSRHLACLFYNIGNNTVYIKLNSPSHIEKQEKRQNTIFKEKCGIFYFQLDYASEKDYTLDKRCNNRISKIKGSKNADRKGKILKNPRKFHE